MKSSGTKGGISRESPQFLIMSLTQAPPLNVAREMLSDLNKKETAEQKRNSLQEPFYSIICRPGAKKKEKAAGKRYTNNVKYI